MKSAPDTHPKNRQICQPYQWIGMWDRTHPRRPLLQRNTHFIENLDRCGGLVSRFAVKGSAEPELFRVRSDPPVKISTVCRNK
jgi:hypothetical protein